MRAQLWRQGFLRPRYNHKKLSEHLKETFGERTLLGDSSLLTGLLVMTKRIDTGSPWPLVNNPNGIYFQAGDHDSWISNMNFPLWKVLRASTAAPSFFDPETLTISEQRGRNPVRGKFVNGGVSPSNNPTLQAFMYATLGGFKVGWNTGVKELLVVSVGTGRSDPSKAPAWIAAQDLIQSLLSLMDDAGALVETFAQWLSTGETHRVIDREIGTMVDDFIGGEPRFIYVRYDLPLIRKVVDALKPGLSDDRLEELTAMDQPANMGLLKELAELHAVGKVDGRHFPAVFDLA